MAVCSLSLKYLVGVVFKMRAVGKCYPSPPSALPDTANKGRSHTLWRRLQSRLSGDFPLLEELPRL